VLFTVYRIQKKEQKAINHPGEYFLGFSPQEFYIWAIILELFDNGFNLKTKTHFSAL
jgi:hypothetical protein